MQTFHDLAVPNVEVRVRAAHSLAHLLREGKQESREENLDYAVKRLVRGVQSSRQCARQGFCLALAEVLRNFPKALAKALPLLAELSGSSGGLKGNEAKDRCFGKLFATVAICQSGALNEAVKEDSSKASSALTQIGSGLFEIFKAKQYVRVPALDVLGKLCSSLCEAGNAEHVPELLQGWPLERSSSNNQYRVYLTGLQFHLHQEYLKLQQKGSSSSSSTKGWPARALTAPDSSTIQQFLQDSATEIRSVQYGEPTPVHVTWFAHWWTSHSSEKSLPMPVAEMWRVMDEALFPESAADVVVVQGFQVIASLVEVIGKTGEALEIAKKPSVAEATMVNFFRQCTRGVGLLMDTLRWSSSRRFGAAVFANDQILAALTAPSVEPTVKNRNPPPPMAKNFLSDQGRLRILTALEKLEGFNVLPKNYQKRWIQILVSSLSPDGLCSRFSKMIKDTANNPDPSKSGFDKVVATNLTEACLHARSPDAVVLSALLSLFSLGFCAPTGESVSSTKPLSDFAEAANFKVNSAAGDVAVLLQCPGSDESLWRRRMWATLSSLLRRTLPQMGEKLVSEGEMAALSDSEGAGSLVKSSAFHGCLSDGSLVVMRIHDWWDHILAGGGASPKKKKKGAKGAAAAGGDYALASSLQFGAETSAARTRIVELCRNLLATSDDQDKAKISKRQKNAVCSLPLCIALHLLAVEEEAERDALTENLQELEAALRKLVELSEGTKSSKKSAASVAEAVAVVPRIAAEIYVNGSGLVKEAARIAWRELGDFIPAETLTSIGGSIAGAEEKEGDEKEDNEKDDSDEEEEDDDEDENDGLTPEEAAAKTKMFEDAKAKLEAERAATKEKNAAQAKAGGGDDDDDDSDLEVLDSDTFFSQLLGDDEDDEQSRALMQSFAGTGLSNNANGKKLTKKRQRFMQRQEDVHSTFRELDLLELYLGRFADSRDVSLELIQKLHAALGSACRRAAKASAENEAEQKGKQGKKEKRNSTEQSMQDLEVALTERLGRVLRQGLRNVLRPPSLKKIAAWQTPAQWEQLAEAVYDSSLKSKHQDLAHHQHQLQAGALLLYLCCAAHHQAANSWKLGERLARQLLESWSTKKGVENYCQITLKVFASRGPAMLLDLPWTETLRGTAKPFVQRSQIAFVSDCLPHFAALQTDKDRALALFDSFIRFCAECLDKSRTDESMTGANKQKLRREALPALRLALKLRSRLTSEELKGSELAKEVAAAASRLRESLPFKGGSVFMRCQELCKLVPKTEAGSTQQKRPAQDSKEGSAKRSKDQASASTTAAAEKSGAVEKKAKEPNAKRSRKAST